MAAGLIALAGLARLEVTCRCGGKPAGSVTNRSSARSSARPRRRVVPSGRNPDAPPGEPLSGWPHDRESFVESGLAHRPAIPAVRGLVRWPAVPASGRPGFPVNRWTAVPVVRWFAGRPPSSGERRRYPPGRRTADAASSGRFARRRPRSGASPAGFPAEQEHRRARPGPAPG